MKRKIDYKTAYDCMKLFYFPYLTIYSLEFLPCFNTWRHYPSLFFFLFALLLSFIFIRFDFIPLYYFKLPGKIRITRKQLTQATGMSHAQLILHQKLFNMSDVELTKMVLDKLKACKSKKSNYVSKAKQYFKVSVCQLKHTRAYRSPARHPRSSITHNDGSGDDGGSDQGDSPPSHSFLKPFLLNFPIYVREFTSSTSSVALPWLMWHGYMGVAA